MVSNPTRGMDVYKRHFCVLFHYLGRSLEIGQSLSTEFYLAYIRFIIPEVLSELEQVRMSNYYRMKNDTY
jgi:hypothetical protein